MHIYIYTYHIDEILQQHRWHIYDILMQHQWKKRTLTVPRSPEQGTVRVRFLHSSLYILCFDICIDWQEEKQMTRLNSLHPSLGAWKDSTLCILPLEPEKTQKQKKKKKQNKKTQKKPRSSNYEPPNLSLESLFSVFFVFFGFQLWSLILCREFCSWGLPVGDAMLKWQVQPYFFFWMGRFMEKSGKRRLPKT